MQSTKTKPKKKGKVLTVLLVILIILAALAAVYFTGLRQGREKGLQDSLAEMYSKWEASHKDKDDSPSQPEPKAVITGEIVHEQLISASKLVTMEYYYTDVGSYENHSDFHGFKIPFTTKSFIVSYDGVMMAGVDLSQAQVDVDEENKTVTITLPDSGIISSEIDNDSLVVFDETNNIFNQIKIEDYRGFAQERREIVMQKAIDRGLLQAADKKAEETVRSLLELLPGMEEYTLKFK